MMVRPKLRKEFKSSELGKSALGNEGVSNSFKFEDSWIIVSVSENSTRSNKTFDL